MQRAAIIIGLALALFSCSPKDRIIELYPDGDIAAAISEALQSDGPTTILLHEGEYRPKQTLRIEGPLPGRLSIRAAEGEQPVICGDIAPEFKASDKENVLRADISLEGIPQLWCNGILQHIARWPDHSFTNAGKVLGVTEVKNPVRRDKSCEEGIFEYPDPRIDAWADEPDGHIHCFASWDWFDDTHKIVSVDKKKHVITLDGPSKFGYREGFRYYGYNLLCELDSPCEYYSDGKSVLWIPPHGYAEGLDAVTVNVFDEDYFLEISNAEGVTLEGICFRGSRKGGIMVKDSRNIVIDKCRIHQLGGDGIHIENSSECSVLNSTIEDIGGTGIDMSCGHTDYTKRNNVVDNCLVRNFSLLHYTYHPAVRLWGTALKMSHCELYGAPSSAINIKGKDILIEYNYIHDVVSESDDQGAMDSFGLLQQRGIVLRHNIWENIVGRKSSAYGAAAIRLDDLICNTQIEGNVFLRCGSIKFGGVQINGGKDNMIERNLFYGCETAVSFSPWTEEKWKERVADKVKDLPKDLQVSIFDNIGRNFIKNNYIVDCRRNFFRETGVNVIEGNTVENRKESIKPYTHYCKKLSIPYKEIGRRH